MKKTSYEDLGSLLCDVGCLLAKTVLGLCSYYVKRVWNCFGNWWFCLMPSYFQKSQKLPSWLLFLRGTRKALKICDEREQLLKALRKKMKQRYKYIVLYQKVVIQQKHILLWIIILLQKVYGKLLQRSMDATSDRLSIDLDAPKYIQVNLAFSKSKQKTQPDCFICTKNATDLFQSCFQHNVPNSTAKPILQSTEVDRSHSATITEWGPPNERRRWSVKQTGPIRN